MLLDEQLAQKFIKKVSTSTMHNINIINEKGIIIASSKDSARIGTFHEVAFDMLKKRNTNSSTAQLTDYSGSSYTGVNLLIKHNDRNIGVCGVTGKPEEVYEIAMMVKIAFETMVEYESQHELLQARKNLNLRFVNALLYEEGDDLITDLPSMAAELGYDPTILRIPILISFDKKAEINVSDLLTRITTSLYHSKQDISFITRNKQIILFKSFDIDMDDLFGQYKYILGEYLSNFLQYVLMNEIQCHFYVGSFQNTLSNYSYSFKHCTWLQHRHRNHTHHAMYFYDYLNDYMQDQVPLVEMHKIFGLFANHLTNDMQENIRETIGTLEENNYNLNTSSKKLFIHKNTLIFRFNKIKKFFDINPVQVPSDRNFISYLNYYLNKIQSKE